MFDSYCLNINPLREGEITTTDSLIKLVASIEHALDLPPGIFCTHTPQGNPVKFFGDYSISLLRTAIIHHLRYTSMEKQVGRAVGIKRASVNHHKKLALDLIRQDHDEFNKYFALVQKIAV
jgi:hypothetical protein